MRPPFVLRIASLVAVLVAFAGLYLAAVRPWALGWGATADEQARVLPGSEISVPEEQSYTRAITIHAPPDVVFAWVSQIGQDRGGFYSYRLLENAVGCEMPSVEHLDPRLQTWQSGDALWMYPRDKMNGPNAAPLVAYVPGRALVFGTRSIGATDIDSTWGFYVEPIDAQSTRLLMRGRGAGIARGPALALGLFGFEPAHFVMERKMMVSVKTLAEGGELTPVADAIAIATWTATFALLVASAVRTLRARRFVRGLASFVAAGALFTFLTYVQPPAVVAVALTLLLVVFAYAPVPRVHFPLALRPTAA